MKIKRVKITNFKSIKNLDVDIDGHVLLIGDNEQGKSSFIEAIEAAFGDTSKAKESAINWEAHSSNIKVYTDEGGNQYRFEVKMKKGRERPIIEVTYPDGQKSNKISTIGSIIGETTFDVDKFVELSSTTAGKRKQVDIIKSLLPQDVQDSLRGFEQRIQEHYDRRTEENRKLKFIESTIINKGIDNDFLVKYKEVKDINVIQAKLEAAQKLEQEHEQNFKLLDDCLTDRANLDSEKKTFIENSFSKIKKYQLKIAELEKAIDDERKAQNDYHKNYDKLEKELGEKTEKTNDAIKAYVQPDILSLKAELADVSEFNSNVYKAKEFREIIDSRLKQEALIDDLTAIIELSKQEIENTVRTLDLPIEGLEFDDEQLYWNGIPVDPQTLSTSQIMELGVLIKMSKNPNAKVILIERGESFGKKKLDKLVSIADQYGWQLFVEKVDSNTQELKIQMI